MNAIIIFNIFYPLILTLIFAIPFITLKFGNIKNKSLICYIFFIAVLNYIAEILATSPLTIPLVLIGTLFFIHLHYKKPIHTVIIVNIVNIIIATAVNIAIMIPYYLFKIPISELFTNNIYLITTYISMLILCYFFSKMIYLLIPKVNYKYIISKKLMKSYSILGIISIIMILTFSTYGLALKALADISSNFSSMITILLIIYFFVIAILLIYSIIEYWLDEKYKNTEYSTLKKYVSEIEESSYELRRFKHDYMNILSTLGDYINNKDMDGLSEFFNNDLLPESKKAFNNDKRLYLLSHINIPPLKSLITNKIIQAINNNIDVLVEVSDDIDNIPVDTLDLCRILGIFLDNAREAAFTCPNKFIHFAAITTDSEIIFVIKNSCPEDTSPVYKLYEEGYSTKGKNRGLGLASIKNLIDEKYENILLNTSVKNCIFTQEIRISLRQETVPNV